MGALKIDCYCNEMQMEKILKMVSNHLSESDGREVADFDDMIGDVRVCVEFETYMDSLELKSSEILDSDWDLLYEDSAVLTSRLRTVVDEYNRCRRDFNYQAHHVINEQWDF